ncbi:MAG: AtpZ/AtpI family protein [Chloroflexota bacterium]
MSERKQSNYSSALASTVIQVGCVTVFIIIGALVLGLWLDRLFDTNNILTIASLLASIPLSLFILVRVALRAAERVKPEQDTTLDSAQDEDESAY